MFSYPVRDLLADPSLQIPVEATWTISSVKSGPETYKCLSPWVIKGILKGISDRVVEFNGTVDTSIQMRCARCLRPVVQPLHIEIRQRFVKGPQDKDLMVLSDEDDFDILPIVNDRVDLDDTIHYEVQLGVPMRVLCKEDCKGLCPICGKDLNEGPCNCKEDDSDPRWDALKNLFSD
jgi:uncharacterized protein